MRATGIYVVEAFPPDQAKSVITVCCSDREVEMSRAYWKALGVKVAAWEM